MQPQDRIFRQAALAKLSSPEQLDQLMQVTNSKSWLALIAFGLLLVAALVWSIFGTIPTRVRGPGILVKPQGVCVVTARGEGSILRVCVRREQVITTGQVVAIMNQPELALKKNQAEIAQRRLEKELIDLVQFHAAEREAEEAELKKQRENYAGMMADCTNQIAALETRAGALNSLFDKGLIGIGQLLDTTNNLFAAKHELARAEVQLKQLKVQQLQADERRRQLRAEQERAIMQGSNQLDLLNQLYDLSSQITSPYAGEVLEILVRDGQIISPSTPIVSLQLAGNTLEARLYLSPADGKLVTNGMRVDLSLVSVKKEEYGLLLGEVNEVSQFPGTPQGMMRILQNSTLVSEFSKAGAPIEVVVSLMANINTASGFSWSSGNGPPTGISSGTLCDGTITVDESRSPISLVFPILNEKRRALKRPSRRQFRRKRACAGAARDLRPRP